MAEEKEPTENEEEGKTPKKSFFKWILLTGIVLLLVIGAYFGWALFIRGGGRGGRNSGTPT